MRMAPSTRSRTRFGALGKNLRAAREYAGLTQAALAKKLRKAQTTVSQPEAGKLRVSEA